MTGGPELADFEADLRRRLADVAADTTLDARAWEKIERRARTGRSRTARTWRQAVAVAAVVAIVVGLVVLSRQGDDSRTETVDQTTTTTERGTSSTTERDRTTTTAAATGELPQRPGSGTGPGSGGADGPGSTGGEAGGGPSRSGPDTGTGSPGGAPGGGTPPTTPPAAGPATPPDGHPVAASIGRSGYTVDVTAYESGGSYYMNLWRDRTQYVAEWSWGKQPGQNCLAGQGSEYGSGDLAGLRFGFVRSDAARVRMVTTSGNTSTAVLGAEFVPGLRAWIGQRPAGQVDRFEALDASGNVLHTAAAPVWDASPDSC